MFLSILANSNLGNHIMRFNVIHTTILCITILGSFLDTTHAATGDAAAIKTAVVKRHDALNTFFKGQSGPMKTL